MLNLDYLMRFTVGETNPQPALHIHIGTDKGYVPHIMDLVETKAHLFFYDMGIDRTAVPYFTQNRIQYS